MAEVIKEKPYVVGFYDGLVSANRWCSRMNNTPELRAQGLRFRVEPVPGKPGTIPNLLSPRTKFAILVEGKMR